MPLTGIEFPILTRFLCAVETTTGMPAQPVDPGSQQGDAQDIDTKTLPKGIVLGPDGKPCRSCTSSAAWMSMMKKSTATPGRAATAPLSSAASSLDTPSDCPPDVDELGSSSWNLLHTIAGAYPEHPTFQQQSDARSFISSFSRLYPCWVCAEDFQKWLREGKNAPRVSSREEFGRWMCEAHNAVNVKLGKDAFDCNRWEERWRTGWKDGSCG